MKKIFLFLCSLLVASCSKVDDHIPNPAISFRSPLSDTLYNNDQNLYSISYTGKISKAEYYFNKQFIGSSIGSPFSISYTFKDALPGTYNLTCIVTANDRQYTKTKKITISLRIGDEFQGGKIFFLNSSKITGLIAAENDLIYDNKQQFEWGTAITTGATDLDNGKQNSATVENAIGSDPLYFWHGLLNYSLNSFSDWYVPSHHEMDILKANMNAIGNFPTILNTPVY
ncbi:MAG: hypothetical protein ABI308_01280 [Mucilaginibacter sp.]